MHTRAVSLGQGSSERVIESNEKIIEVFSSYRESVVRNRRDDYARQIGALRYSISDIAAEIYFLPYISKYVIEIAVIVGAVFVGTVQFFLQDAMHAFTTLTVFLAAGTKIAPAVLRLLRNGREQFHTSRKMYWWYLARFVKMWHSATH
jgi:ATP-binding cassette subfamily C protein